jgi:hypothetical protein
MTARTLHRLVGHRRGCACGTFVTFLAMMQPHKDLTRILSSQLWWLGDRFPGIAYRSSGIVEAVLRCGVRWEETDPEKLTAIRRSLLRISDYDLKRVMACLGCPEICAPATFEELLRTPGIRQRLLALGLVKKPVSVREQRRIEHAKRADESREKLDESLRPSGAL